MRTGVRLGVDVGSVRVGVAAATPPGCSPPGADRCRATSAAAPTSDAIAAVVPEHAALEVVVGLPRSLSGQEGPAAALARDYAGRLARAGSRRYRCAWWTSG